MALAASRDFKIRPNKHLQLKEEKQRHLKWGRKLPGVRRAGPDCPGATCSPKHTLLAKDCSLLCHVTPRDAAYASCGAAQPPAAVRRVSTGLAKVTVTRLMLSPSPAQGREEGGAPQAPSPPPPHVSWLPAPLRWAQGPGDWSCFSEGSGCKGSWAHVWPADFLQQLHAPGFTLSARIQPEGSGVCPALCVVPPAPGGISSICSAPDWRGHPHLASPGTQGLPHR